MTRDELILELAVLEARDAYCGTDSVDELTRAYERVITAYLDDDSGLPGAYSSGLTGHITDDVMWALDVTR